MAQELNESDTVLSAQALSTMARDILIGAGADAEEARIQADFLVEGDLRGHPSHGVRRLHTLVSRLKNDRIHSGRGASHEWVTDSVLRVDGRKGFGPVVARGAVDAIVQRAATTGIALATVANSNHIGMLAPYLEAIAAAGQVGFAFTTSEALVHAWGGMRAVVGTNPIGIGVPTRDLPLVLDMSTAAVPVGRILDHASRGEPIPLGWAIDETGGPTTDARAALDGAVSPFGGPKGFALGIALEAMVAVLSATALGSGIKGTLDSDYDCSKGDIFVAISLERLGVGGMIEPLTAYLEEVRRSGADPLTPLDVPGDRARRVRAERLAVGVPVNATVWETIRALHAEYVLG